MRLALLALPLLLAGTAPGLARQQAPSQGPAGAGDDSEIVVIGKERKAEIHDMVRTLAAIAPGSTEPMGRFDDTRICPAVVGLSEEHNAAISARMRRVTEAVGIETGKSGCLPNALVIIAGKKDEVIKELRHVQPVYFQDPRHRQIAIARQPGPVTAWHLAGPVDRDGIPPAINDNGQYLYESPMPGSLIRSALRPKFYASVVVIQSDSLVGLTTTQVADYATMRVLAEIPVAGTQAVKEPTILNVIQTPFGQPVPPTLTQWDLTYLRGLYSTAVDHSARMQRGEIERAMARELAKSEKRQH